MGPCVRAITPGSRRIVIEWTTPDNAARPIRVGRCVASCWASPTRPSRTNPTMCAATLIRCRR